MNRVGGVLVCLLSFVWFMPGLAAVDRAAVGESIYLRGMVGNGAMLIANREAGLGSAGAAAACVNCHRHSGLGTKEGRQAIPPITGRYLFQPRTLGRDDTELTFVEGAHGNRDAYTDATLGRAIRDGRDSMGRTLDYLMPRYVLSDADLAALIDYLKHLDADEAMGGTDTVLHFASIITPEADPVDARGMRDVLEHFFADKNTFPFPPSPRMRSSGKTLYAKSMYMANRRWQLDVWNLQGQPATWAQQLDQHFARSPVLAVVSGAGGRHWAPVHQFCEQSRVPCLFPNVEVPVGTDGDFYSLYFSKGVLLEAELIAKRLGESSAPGRTNGVSQIYRANDSGQTAAAALAASLKMQGIPVRDTVLPAGAPAEVVSEALHRAAAADVLVLWLRPPDLAAMGETVAAPPQVFMSGLMGGLDHAPLPASWRSRTRLAYPLDLPQNSAVRVRMPLEWFSIKHIPVVAERIQVDTYLACGLLAETVNHMADTFGHAYLVERMEEMLEHRLLTGYYPRLALADGQRFASKGGYLVQFTGPQGSQVQADGGWTVP